MKSRYCYTPYTAKHIGRRVTLMDRIRRRRAMRRMEKADVFTICNFYPPVYPK